MVCRLLPVVFEPLGPPAKSRSLQQIPFAGGQKKSTGKAKTKGCAVRSLVCLTLYFYYIEQSGKTCSCFAPASSCVDGSCRVFQRRTGLTRFLRGPAEKGTLHPVSRMQGVSETAENVRRKCLYGTGWSAKSRSRNPCPASRRLL